MNSGIVQERWLSTEAPNGLALSRRKRMVSHSKIRTILCAQRSVTAPCWVAFLSACLLKNCEPALNCGGARYEREQGRTRHVNPSTPLLLFLCTSYRTATVAQTANMKAIDGGHLIDGDHIDLLKQIVRACQNTGEERHTSHERIVQLLPDQSAQLPRNGHQETLPGRQL